MSSFQIPEGPTRIAPGDAAAFTVTNVAREALRGRASVQAGGAAKADWFTVDGDRERPFAAGESQTVTVKAAAPAGTPPGDHQFRLRVVAVNDPDNDVAESPPVSLVLADAKPKPGMPGWVWAVVALVVLAVVGGGAYYALRPSEPNPTPKSGPVPAVAAAMPDLVGSNPMLDQGEAVRRLRAIDPTLDIDVRMAKRSDVLPETVVGQAPAAGAALPKGAPIRLTVSHPWFLGTWTGTLDGRPSTMRWFVVGTGPERKIGGDFSDGSTGRYVPLTHDSNNANRLFLRHADGNQWMLAETGDGQAQGWSTWQGRQFPLVMSRKSLTIDGF